MNRPRIVLAGAAILAASTLLAPGARASGPEIEGWHHGQPFAYEKGLLDYVKFPRAALAEKGVNVHLSALGIWQAIADGGLERTSRGSGSYDLQVYLDSARLGLWEGGHALIRVEGKTSEGINLLTGAVIPVNFDAVVPELEANGIEATEWWFAQSFAGGKVEALVGMWDTGRFFDVAPFSGPYHYRFLNAHMFFNSVLLPYAPYNNLGGVLTVKPVDWLTISTGVSDRNSTAVDVDWFSSGDINLTHQWDFKARPFGRLGLYKVGFAYTNENQTTIAQDPTSAGTDTRSNDWAVYLNFNQWLYQDPDHPQKAIGIFGRIGITDGEVNLIRNHFSAGVSFDEMIPSRPKDVLGIVGWYNIFSDDLSRNLDDSSAGFEAYYRFQATPWLQISPDVQYLIDPGIAGGDNTWVLGFRALVHF